MSAVHDNTPVLIGVGFAMNRSLKAQESPEPLDMMELAIRDASRDAFRSGAMGSEGESANQTKSDMLLGQLECIAVQQGMWQYPNPAHHLANTLGCRAAETVLSDLGILQLTPLFELCDRISRGEQQLGVVTGGETKFRELRAKIAGEQITNSTQPDDTPAPDQHLVSSDPFASDIETHSQVFMPVQLFALIESALRAHKGLDVESHRDYVAEMYARFSEIAAYNPHAWHQDALQPSAIRNADDKNSMLAFPYTKKHNTQWNVNQSVAIIACSIAKAKELGIDETRWVYPFAAVRSNYVVTLGQQRTLHTHAGTRMIGERLMAITGTQAQNIDYADLYSCFPAAVQSFALDLELEGVCDYSVTGSMAFAGGPYNHAALDGVARMVEVLRDDKEQFDALGLVSNLSGIFGKTGVMLLGTRPRMSYQFEDITEAVAAVDGPLDTDLNYVGEATIVGYTVDYFKGVPTRALILADTLEGKRTMASCDDSAVVQAMLSKEFVGVKVQVLADNRFQIQ